MDLEKKDESTTTTEKDINTSKLENENNQDSNECTIPKSSGSSPNKCIKRSYLEVSSTSSSNGNSDLNKYKNFLLKPLETKRFKLSETIDKVKQFLPTLKESTDKLLNECKENPDLVNMENVNEDQEQVIEMNLAFVSDSSDDDEEEVDEEEDNTSESQEEEEEVEENDETDEKVLDIDKLAEYSHKKSEFEKLIIEKKVNKKSKKPLIKILSDDSNTNNEDVKCINNDENSSNTNESNHNQNKCEIVDSSNDENK